MNKVFPLLFLLLLPLLAMTKEQEELQSDPENHLRLGILTRQDVLSREIYERHYAAYTPKPESIREIHNFVRHAEIKVFFGDWCKDSKKHVPALIKSIESADNKNIEIIYINLDREKKEPAEFMDGWDIQSVPTMIVLIDGKETGRIIETPKTSVEQDLAEILTGRKPSTESSPKD